MSDLSSTARLGRAMLAVAGGGGLILWPALALTAWVGFAQCSTGPFRWAAAGAALATAGAAALTLSELGWRYMWLPTGVALMAPHVIGLAVPLVDLPDPFIPWSSAVACRDLSDQTGTMFLIGVALVVAGSVGRGLTRGPRVLAPPPLQRSPR